jgi:ABC-type lipoprotein export system ATPase subunit
MSQPIIVLEGIWKIYSSGGAEVCALRDVSGEIRTGEMVAIIGASGSGKSTLLHILGCLDRPTRGRWFLEGRPIAELSPNQLAAIRSQKIGFIFQSFNLLARTSAAENVALPLLYAGQNLSRAACCERVETALARVGLLDRAGHRRPSYPVASSNGTPLLEPWLINWPFCWPMSRLGTSTLGPARNFF